MPEGRLNITTWEDKKKDLSMVWEKEGQVHSKGIKKEREINDIWERKWKRQRQEARAQNTNVHITLEKIKKLEPDTDIKCVGNS